MKEVEEAITARFEGTAGLSDFGQLTYARNMDRVQLPFAVFSKISGTPEEALGVRYSETMRYKFSLFHTNKDTLDAATTALHTAFDRYIATLTAPLVWVSCNRVMHVTYAAFERPATNQYVYQSVTDYIIQVDRTF